jgi:hypothetical protein
MGFFEESFSNQFFYTRPLKAFSALGQGSFEQDMCRLTQFGKTNPKQDDMGIP